MKSLPCWRRATLAKEIAKILHLSYETIRGYLKKLRTAFNVHSTREILLMADIPVPHEPKAVILTPRGKEVMELFMRGYTYKEIAERLSISISGVYRHREKMLLQNKDEDTDKCVSMLKLAAKHQAWLAAQHDGAAITDSE